MSGASVFSHILCSEFNFFVRLFPVACLYLFSCWDATAYLKPPGRTTHVCMHKYSDIPECISYLCDFSLCFRFGLKGLTEFAKVHKVCHWMSDANAISVVIWTRYFALLLVPFLIDVWNMLYSRVRMHCAHVWFVQLTTDWCLKDMSGIQHFHGLSTWSMIWGVYASDICIVMSVL